MILSEGCLNCEDTEIVFTFHGNIQQCPKCGQYFRLDSYWESGEGILVNELREVDPNE